MIQGSTNVGWIQMATTSADIFFSTNVTASGVTTQPWCLYPYIRRLAFPDTLANRISFIIQVPIMLSLTIVGLTGNALSFIVIGKETRKNSNSFLLQSLAVLDNAVLLIYAVYISLSGIYPYTGKMIGYYEIHQYMDRYLFFTSMALKTAAIYMIVLVTAERYIAVCLPLRAKSLCTVMNARIAVFILCLVCFLYNIPTVFQVQLWMVKEPCSGLLKPYSSMSEFRLTNIYFTVIYVHTMYYVLKFLVPVGIMLYMNFHLVRSLRAATNMQSQKPADSNRRQTQATTITRRVLAVSVVFISLEFPAVLLNFIYLVSQSLTTNESELSRYVGRLMVTTYILQTINSLVNFYIYVLTGKSFRRTMRQVLCCG
ncbi:FMRFamide receptor-like [Lineus longissimus]|uniref:FMRFamide receptor-like n=1 Tax=Lineus longissimus TaxID=88925 RepID=UPI00315DABDF